MSKESRKSKKDLEAIKQVFYDRFLGTAGNNEFEVSDHAKAQGVAGKLIDSGNARGAREYLQGVKKRKFKNL
jgi:predicted Ser/Thr protein kinase